MKISEYSVRTAKTTLGGIARWLRYADMHPLEQPWPNAELSGVSGWHGTPAEFLRQLRGSQHCCMQEARQTDQFNL